MVLKWIADAFTLVCLATSANAASLNTSISRPHIDESFYLLGKFDAISNYDTPEKYNLSNPTVDSLYEVSSSLFSGNSSVHILDFSPFNESTPSQLYNVDNSTLLAIVSGQPVLYDTDSNVTSSLEGWDSVSGNVSTAYVDQNSSLLYLGGNLEYNDSYGALIYNLKQQKLVELPFLGFGEGSLVHSILKYGQESIIFGGQFDSLGNDTLTEVGSTNATSSNSTSSANGTSSSSSALIEPEQVINIGLSSISVSNGASGSNPDNLLCPDGSSSAWKMSTSQVGGTWSAELPFSVTPSKIRLYNGNDGENAVKLFRIITAPANSIMNLTYIDPRTRKLAYCDAWCPLTQDSELADDISDANNVTNGVYQIADTSGNQGTLGFSDDYQEFGFVNSIQMNSITIQILDQYGDYAVLNGLQLLQYGMTVYSNNTLNGSGCNSSSSTDGTGNEIVSSASSEIVGSSKWSSSSNGGDYLLSTVSSKDINKQDGVQYNLDLSSSGNYTFLLYTPGCGSDDTCGERGTVNATLYAQNGTALASHLIFQTNTELKYDVIFSGDIEISSGDDSSVYLKMTCDQSSGSSNTTFVAGSVVVQFNSVDYEEETVQSIPLNGLFEYSLKNFTDGVANPVGNSSINLLGSTKLSKSARVSGLQLANSTSLFVAGDFNSTYGDNFFGIKVESYNTTSSEVTLGDKVDVSGSVTDPVTQLSLAGDDDLVLVDGGVSIFGSNGTDIAVLSAARDETVSGISSFKMNETEYIIVNYNSSTSGVSSSILSLPDGQGVKSTNIFKLNLTSALSNVNDSSSSSIVYGQITLFDRRADGILFVAKDTQNSFESIESIFDPESSSVTDTGLYLNSSAVILAGSYDTDGKDVIVVGAKSSSALSDKLNILNDTTVTTLEKVGDSIFIGLDGAGASFGGKTGTGLVVYDYVHQNATIPSIDDGSSVNAICIVPSSDSAIVGGNFTANNGVSNLAYYNLSSNSLNPALNDETLTGIVNGVMFYSKDEALVGGDLDIGSNGTGYFGVYNWTSRSITADSKFDNTVPAAVSKFAFLNGNKTTSLSETIVAMGSNYIGYLKDYKYESLMSGINNHSNTPVFKDFALLNTSTSSSVLGDKVLVLAGRFELEEYGLVTSAIFDGSNWSPLSITASDLNVTASVLNFILRTTEEYSLTVSTTQPPTSSPGPSSTQSELRYLTNGQIAGIGCALAVGTTMLLTTIGGLFYLFGNKDTVVGPLESRVGEERMMSVVPPSQVIDNMKKARAGDL